MSEFLLEFFGEEIPARMQRKGAQDLGALIKQGLEQQGLSFDHQQCLWTPRRITIHMTGLAKNSPDKTIERRGPKFGAPEQALAGFLRASGLDNISQAELRDTDKGQFYFSVQQVAGQPTQELLPQIIQNAVQALVWPKSMRFGRSQFRWVRPLHNVLALFDQQVLQGALDMGEGESLPFTEHSYGHRFLAPQAITVRDFADYKQALKKAFVIVDPQERQQLIFEQTQALAKQHGLVLIPDQGLLDEVTNLVEWPCALLGAFSKEYLSVPQECLILSMKENQKYFALKDQAGKLSHHFITISNITSKDGGAQIIKGNERVLHARLSDAQFFWQQDQKQRLDARIAGLDAIVFHAKIGSLAEKVARTRACAEQLAALIPQCDPKQAARAAELAKADLMTEMVQEFPELQGVMGQYYAQNDGEAPAVCLAIREHYAPQGPSEPCPSAPVSVALALAEKITMLGAFWAIDEKPTGSKDPFALRRAALGVIRLILENNLELALLPWLEKACNDQSKAQDLLGFIHERLKALLRDQGLRYDSIEAVLATRATDKLSSVVRYIKAIEAFRDQSAGQDLIAAYKRASNLIGFQNTSADKHITLEQVVNKALIQASCEQDLYQAALKQLPLVQTALAQEQSELALQELASLRQPLDRYLDQVVVNSDDPKLRANRHALLSCLVSAMSAIADFSKLEG